VNEAARLNAAGAAVYVTLNPINPQLLARFCNRVEGYAKATATDKDVVRRCWLLIDFDPVRPTDTSATDAQVATAQERARACYQALKAEGWTRPPSRDPRQFLSQAVSGIRAGVGHSGPDAGLGHP
jgi:hypothetical protein